MGGFFIYCGMKKLGVLLLIPLILSCAAKPVANDASNNDSHMPVIVSGTHYAHVEFDYFYGLKNTDTVVFVVKPGIKADGGRRVAYIKYNGLHTIDKLIEGQDTLHFVYSLPTVNNDMKVLAGSGPPGKMQATMHTIKSFPYLIVNDSVFVYEE